MKSVAFEQNGFCSRDRPCDLKGRIVPKQTPLMLARIGRVNLIKHFRIRFRRAVGMSETSWDKKLATVFRAQHRGTTLPIGRRPPAYVDGDIPYRAPHDPNQLSLRKR